MLMLTPHIMPEAPDLVQRREPSDVIEAGLVRSAVVVVDRLPQMEAVAQRRSSNSHQPRIRRMQSVHGSTRRTPVWNRGAELRQQLCQYGLRLFVVAVHDVILRCLQHMQRTPARPWPHPEKRRVEEAHRV